MRAMMMGAALTVMTAASPALSQQTAPPPLFPGITPGDWVRVTADTGMPTDLIQSFMRRMDSSPGGLVLMGMRMEFAAPSTVQGREVLSGLAVVQIDCARWRRRRISLTSFAEHNLKAQVRHETATGPWKPVSKIDQAELELMALACPTAAKGR